MFLMVELLFMIQTHVDTTSLLLVCFDNNIQFPFHFPFKVQAYPDIMYCVLFENGFPILNFLQVTIS